MREQSAIGYRLFPPGHAPHAALVVAAGIGLVVGSLNASKTLSARRGLFPPSSRAAWRNACNRKSSLPSARSTRSRNAAISMSLCRASRN